MANKYRKGTLTILLILYFSNQRSVGSSAAAITIDKNKLATIVQILKNKATKNPVATPNPPNIHFSGTLKNERIPTPAKNATKKYGVYFIATAGLGRSPARRSPICQRRDCSLSEHG